MDQECIFVTTRLFRVCRSYAAPSDLMLLSLISTMHFQTAFTRSNNNVGHDERTTGSSKLELMVLAAVAAGQVRSSQVRAVRRQLNSR